MNLGDPLAADSRFYVREIFLQKTLLVSANLYWRFHVRDTTNAQR